MEQLFEKDKSLTLYKSGLFYIQIEYYRNTGQYRKALDVIEEIKNDSSSINKYLDYTLTQKQGDIYWEMNQKARAAQYYRDYILATDSIRSQEIQNSTNEFYTIMEVEQLHKEKKMNYCCTCRKKKLQKINIALVSLVIILVAGTMLLFHISKLNKKTEEIGSQSDTAEQRIGRKRRRITQSQRTGGKRKPDENNFYPEYVTRNSHSS